MRCFVLALALWAVALPACGGDGLMCPEFAPPCVCFCLNIESKLEDQIPDAKVNCWDSAWQAAHTCEDCLEVLEKLYDASATSPAEICYDFFWQVK